MEKVSILIVEDDMIIGANLSLQLTQLGYEVKGVVPRGEEAIVHAKEDPPNMVLMDIQLKGNLSGVETARAIQQHADIPIVYLTANSDDATFEKARATRPKAFLSKPFHKLDLQRTLALVVEGLNQDGSLQKSPDVTFLPDRIFIRCHGRMVKLMLDDILYLEADRNYCKVVCTQKEYLMSSSLKTIGEKLSSSKFLRVHRSFMVNISRLDAVAEDHLEINRKCIPLSKPNKELLMRHLRTL
ncbi:LytR/AlgR family response regulator transcription factor [Maribacter sp. 2307ULW6-5]|uniref:LytR/AlgR family response regulator transcription factor n=1 Tax=Maribacter sp. 2307ULW6-5 TaxID=3386275 RepID=UPI0039BC63D2